MSTFHWYPTVNGYSGNYPPSYLARLERLRRFPDATSLVQLRRDGVRYVIVHVGPETASALEAIRAALGAAQMIEVGSFEEGGGSAILFAAR
jgi:hypothetical protein